MVDELRAVVRVQLVEVAEHRVAHVFDQLRVGPQLLEPLLEIGAGGRPLGQAVGKGEALIIDLERLLVGALGSSEETKRGSPNRKRSSPIWSSCMRSFS